MDDTTLTVLYTACLAGRLDVLPRLFARIRQARAAAPGPVLLLDLGGACDPAAWECAATEGRAALLVLEAMGYDVALLDDVDSAALTPGAVARLREKVSLAVCGSHPVHGLAGNVLWRRAEWRVACGAGEDVPREATLIVRPRREDDLSNLDAATRTLWLALPGDALGVAVVRQQAAARLTLIDYHTLPLTDDLRPDPTVSAAVAFVREEARLYSAGQATGGAYAAGQTG